MPGQFPTAIADISEEYELTSNQPVFTSRSQSGRRFSRLGSGHRWEIKLKPADLTVSEYRTLNGFLMKQKGMYSTFTLALPGYAIGGTVAGSPTVTSVTDDNTVVLGGLNTGDNVKAGDLLTFAGQTKVYCVTDDASESSGAMTINIEPALVATPAATEAVEFNNPLFTVATDDRKIAFTRRGIFYSFSISFVEVY